jgi:hypothetical protein
VPAHDHRDVGRRAIDDLEPIVGERVVGQEPGQLVEDRQIVGAAARPQIDQVAAGGRQIGRRGDAAHHRGDDAVGQQHVVGRALPARQAQLARRRRDRTYI